MSSLWAMYALTTSRPRGMTSASSSPNLQRRETDSRRSAGRRWKIRRLGQGSRARWQVLPHELTRHVQGRKMSALEKDKPDGVSPQSGTRSPFSRPRRHRLPSNGFLKVYATFCLRRSSLKLGERLPRRKRRSCPLHQSLTPNIPELRPTTRSAKTIDHQTVKAYPQRRAHFFSSFRHKASRAGLTPSIASESGTGVE